MRPLLLLPLLVGSMALAGPPVAPAPAAPASGSAPGKPGAPAAPAPTAPATKPVPAPLPPAKPRVQTEDFGAGTQGTAPSGAVVRADTRDEYLSGFPILVEVALNNPTAAPIQVPDLSARPHLVHFKLVSPDGKLSERYTTPPPFDTGGDWTLAPRGGRTVLLEIPSSAALDMGDWQLNVMVGDGEKAVVLPTQKFRIVPAKPVAGDPVWEPTIARNSGAVLSWVHAARGGFDVYLDQYAAGDGSRLLARSRLFRATTAIQPVLSISQANAPRSRWLYWLGAPNEVRAARVEGTRISGSVRSLGAPWPKIELLGRGVSDGAGGVMVPVWVPNPKGDSGGVKVLVMGERGEVHFRNVGELPARPPIVSTAIDASGGLVIALAHPKGLDVYRAAPKDDVKLPLKGVRAWKPGDGWTTGAVAFDSLPDKDGRAGGLSILAVQTLPGVDTTPPQARTLRLDLSGKLWETGTPIPWTAPTTFEQLVPSAYDPFRALTRDAAGVAWFTTAGSEPVSLGKVPAAQVWPLGADGWRVRWLAGEKVLSEKAVTVAK